MPRSEAQQKIINSLVAIAGQAAQYTKVNAHQINGKHYVVNAGSSATPTENMKLLLNADGTQHRHDALYELEISNMMKGIRKDASDEFYKAIGADRDSVAAAYQFQRARNQEVIGAGLESMFRAMDPGLKSTLFLNIASIAGVEPELVWKDPAMVIRNNAKQFSAYQAPAETPSPGGR